MTYDQEKVYDLTASIQKECHQTVEAAVNHPELKSVTVQDATNVFLFKKLADLEYRVQQLEAAAMMSKSTNTF
jgi:hypothetical protein